MTDTPSISPALRDRVLARLALTAPVTPDLAGLAALYRAWCDHIPFDNVRKLIALRSGSTAPLPGTTGTDFFEHFLAHGTGGTCWPTSEAMFELCESIGFVTRRVAGSMRDQGFVTHGTVKVTLDGVDWLADTSILSNVLLPAASDVFISGDPIFTAEVEPTDIAHIVWFSIPPNAGYTPCRLLVDPIDHEYLSMSYEKSKGFGAFNQHIYARRNFPGLMVVMRGPILYRRTAAGTTQEALTPDGVCAVLKDIIGISDAMIQEWIDVGGLAATFEPFSGPPPVVPPSTPPSSKLAR
jgi:N-hydroxyarylamine O-acetyltransferase